MFYIDNQVLYSDNSNDDEWQELIRQSRSKSSYWRRYARRKMRRVEKELLRGIRPRLKLSS